MVLHRQRLCFVVFALVSIAGCAGSVDPPRAAPAHTSTTPTGRRVQKAPSGASAVGAAMAELVPYSTDGRSLRAIKTLWELGHSDPNADEARYLAAASSLDYAAVATLRDDDQTIAALAQIRELPDGQNRPALYTAIASELRTVREGVYAGAARGLVEGVELMQLGPSSPRGAALMLDMLRRRAPAAHIASLYYVEMARRAVVALARTRDAQGLSALAALSSDPCATSCAGSPLENVEPSLRRAAASVQQAHRRATEGLRVNAEDPFAALAQPLYGAAKDVLASVVLDQRTTSGVAASRVVVELGLVEARIRVLPLVAIIDGEVDAAAARPGPQGVRVVRYAPRWGAKVTPYEPFVQAARDVRAVAQRLTAGGEAPPVSIAAENELEAHVLARVILSLMSAGLEDVRLRRTVAGTVSEVRLRPVAGNRVDERETRGRARVDVCGPFDYDGAERTFQRQASAGRPASAHLVLFALIASRALYRALDAVHVAWPNSIPDVLLVLPQQVP
jgi:hypothetical protein